MKECGRCHETKPLDDFTANRRRLDGLDRYCRDCKKLKYKGDYAKYSGPEYNKSVWRRLKERRVARLGPVPRGCEICGAKFVPGSQATAEHWDHNHDTGDGRGWLCLSCNAGLGAFGDNPIIIELAAKYLRKRGGFLTRPVFR